MQVINALVRTPEEDIFRSFYLYNEREINSLNIIADSLINNVRSGDIVFTNDLNLNKHTKNLIKQSETSLIKKGIILKNAKQITTATLSVLDEKVYNEAYFLALRDQIDDINLEIKNQNQFSYFRKISKTQEDIAQTIVINGREEYLFNLHIDLNDPQDEFLYIELSKEEYRDQDYYKYPGEKIVRGIEIFFKSITELGRYLDFTDLNYLIYQRESSNKELKFILKKNYLTNVLMLEKEMNFSNYERTEILLSNSSSHDIGSNLFFSYNHFASPNTFIYCCILFAKYYTILMHYYNRNIGYNNDITKLFINPNASYYNSDIDHNTFNSSRISIIAKTGIQISNDGNRVYEKFSFENMIMHDQIDLAIIDIFMNYLNTRFDKLTSDINMQIEKESSSETMSIGNIGLNNLTMVVKPYIVFNKNFLKSYLTANFISLERYNEVLSHFNVYSGVNQIKALNQLNENNHEQETQ